MTAEGRILVIRRLAVVAALLLGVLAFGRPADAGTYEFSCGFVFDPPVIDPGGEVHVLGSGFEPGSLVEFFIEGEPLGSATASDDSDGNIDATFTLPEEFDVDGEYTITVECPDGNVASNVIIVGAGVVTTLPPTTVAPVLPVTGSDSTSELLRIGVGLVLLGGVVLALSRHRARAALPTS